MKSSSPWASILAIVVQVAGLGLCVWAMESSMKRGNVLTGGTTPPAEPLERTPPGSAPMGTPMPPSAPPPPPFGATPPTWSPGTPGAGA